MKKMIFVTSLLVVFLTSNLVGQNSSTFKPGWFVGLNGGTNWFLGEGNNMITNPNPTNGWDAGKSMGYLARLELGYNFNSVYAVRFMGGTNKYNYYTTVKPVSSFRGQTLTGDFMVNISNLLNDYDVDRKFTFAAFAGLGLSYMNENVNTSKIGGTFLRGGLQGNYHISPAWTLSLIAENSLTSDNTNDFVAELFFDMAPALALSVNYRFGANDETSSVVDDKLPMSDKPVVQSETPKAEAQNQVVPAPVVPTPVVPEPIKPEPKVEQVIAKVEIPAVVENVFYRIDSADIATAEQKNIISKIAEYLKKYPEARVVVSGYADNATGTAEYNRLISKRRATTVANALVNNYGISADRLDVKWFGSDEQPFSETIKNRVVILKSL